MGQFVQFNLHLIYATVPRDNARVVVVAVVGDGFDARSAFVCAAKVWKNRL